LTEYPFADILPSTPIKCFFKIVMSLSIVPEGKTGIPRLTSFLPKSNATGIIGTFVLKRYNKILFSIR
jgi:hypothetical protein